MSTGVYERVFFLLVSPSSYIVLGRYKETYIQHVVRYGNCRWSQSTKNPHLRHPKYFFFNNKKPLSALKLENLAKNETNRIAIPELTSG